ncbi:hypothetical protein OU415_06755 [Saccharopolyspora sp. WRP15-2]|uniref:Uncharacterized protein n=1 Tax=Saccharopolyspora oryzae TaxID=2997343 RepID=A0ABT4UVN0_9PSEU|nr:hypothetical protein [Saccharopolyspora oryzae]MDA3625127.1 hypothetical protein [Saccharopolyspora oryzae]
MPTQHLAGLAWQVCEAAGEDVLVPREKIMGDIGATYNQFTRLKAYIWDFIAREKGKVFIAFRGAYIVTTDPAKVAENIKWKLTRIRTELKRMLTGSIEPFGDQVAQYEVLKLYQDDISYMLRQAERMELAARGLPEPVKIPQRKRPTKSRRR